MGKVKEYTIEGEVSEVEGDVDPKASDVGNLTHNAISLCHVPGEGWSLIVLKYNPMTGEVGKPEKRRTGEGLAYIKERFRIDAVNPVELDGLDIFNNSGNKW